MSNLISQTNRDVPFNALHELKQLADLLRTHWRPIGLAALAGVVLASIHLLVARKTYRATARLLVLSQQADPIQSGSGGQVERSDGQEVLPTQASIITSRAICEHAINRVGIKELPSLAREEDPVEAALESLSVTRPDRVARIIQIDYLARSRAESEAFVRGLIEAYREFLVADVYRKTSQSIIDLVNRSQGGLRSELDALQSKYIEFRKAHPGIVVSADGKPGYNTSVERLSQLVAAIGELEIRSIKFQSEFDLVQSLAQHGGGLWCTAFAIGELGNGRDLLQSVDSRVNSDYLRTLVRERQELIAEHGPDTSKAQELTARISQLQGGANMTEVIAAMERVKYALEASKAEYDAKLSTILAQVRDDELALLEESTLRNELERHRVLYNLVLDRVKRAALSSDYGAVNFLVVDEPRAGLRPVAPNSKLELALGCMMGAVVGLALAFRSRSRYAEL